MDRSHALPLLLALLAGAALLAGCGECEETPASSTFQATHRVTVETPYYLTGPQQARPPEGTFAAGTRVRLVEEAGSYDQVQTEDGTRAYVAADALEILAP